LPSRGTEAALQSQAALGSPDLPAHLCEAMLSHRCIPGGVHLVGPSAAPASQPARSSPAPRLAHGQEAPRSGDLSCNHQLADNHYW